MYLLSQYKCRLGKVHRIPSMSLYPGILYELSEHNGTSERQHFEYVFP